MSPGWIGELAGERKDFEALIREIERLAARIERNGLPWVVAASERGTSAKAPPREAAPRAARTRERGFWESPAGKVVASLAPFEGWLPALAGLLFGGRERETPAPLARFVKADPVRVDAGLIGGEEITPVVRGQGHGARVAAGGVANVTVQVQAMDSRSFLEHSREIADAVRLALLSGHELNDAVREL
jgi:hypothetical protein